MIIELGVELGVELGGSGVQPTSTFFLNNFGGLESLITIIKDIAKITRFYVRNFCHTFTAQATINCEISLPFSNTQFTTKITITTGTSKMVAQL